MGRYTRDIYDKDDEFYSSIYFLFIVALVVLLLIALFGAMDTSFASSNARDENNLHLALQGKETNDTKAIATAQVIREMYDKKFNDWLYLGSLMGDQSTIDNDRNSMGFALLNWNETVEYLEDPDKAVPENHAWKDAIEWYLCTVAIITILAINLGYVSGALDSKVSDVYKYPWKENWALPWVIPLAPYILLTQPFVLLYMVLREGYEKFILKDDQTQLPRSAEEFEFESEPTRRSFREHSDYVRSEEETNKLGGKFEKVVQKVIEKTERSKKNFETFYRNVLKREMDDKVSLITDFRRKLSSLGVEIEETQREIVEATKQKEDIEKRIVSMDPEQIVKEFEKILKLPLVEAVEIADDLQIIDIYTKKIFINYNGRKFEIGNFLITLNMKFSNKKIKNLTSTTNWARYHPYNNYEFSTSFCFGKAESTIYEALGNNNILLATTLILQALQTGEGDSTEMIDYWREVEVEKV